MKNHIIEIIAQSIYDCAQENGDHSVLMGYDSIYDGAESAADAIVELLREREYKLAYVEV